jgi:hypothetical protein
MIVVCRHISESVNLNNVSFFTQGSVDPVSDQGIFFNVAQNVFKSWNTALGKYVPVVTTKNGDVKYSYLGGDELTDGWVLLDGRAIAAVAGITTPQKNVLESIFGTGAYIPDVKTLGAFAGMPTAATINAISIPTVSPAVGVIGALPIAAGYSQSEVTALKNATETLDVSSHATQAGAASLKTQVAAIASALAPNTITSYVKIFVGYP